MKKFYIEVFILIIFISLCIPFSAYTQQRTNVINKLDFISGLRISDELGYISDGVIVILRKIENRPIQVNENYDNLDYKCYAEARFFKNGNQYVTVDSVLINNVKLDAQPFGSSNYYFTSSNYIHNVQSLNPKISINVYGNELETYNSDSALSFLKFPDFYYISNYSQTALINQPVDWNMTVSKCMTGTGFSLPKPSLLRAWVLSLSGPPQKSLSNFQPLIKKDDVSSDSYSGTVESKYNIFDSRVCLPGQGCAVVRTFKQYLVSVQNVKKGTTEVWTVYMGVESEVPVNFQ